MRAILGKSLQVAGAVVCVAALAFGLGLTPSGRGSLAGELLLLVAGLLLLAFGVWLVKTAR